MTGVVLLHRHCCGSSPSLCGPSLTLVWLFSTTDVVLSHHDWHGPSASSLLWLCSITVWSFSDTGVVILHLWCGPFSSSLTWSFCNIAGVVLHHWCGSLDQFLNFLTIFFLVYDCHISKVYEDGRAYLTDLIWILEYCYFPHVLYRLLHRLPKSTYINLYKVKMGG